MCLWYSPVSTGNVRRQLNKTGKIVCYKLLKIQKRKMFSIYYTTIWKSGWMISNRSENKKNARDDWKMRNRWTLYNGIHVYLKSRIPNQIQIRSLDQGYMRQKRSPYTIDDSDIILIPVTCYAEDFVGAGRGEVVFTKVFVEKEDFKKCKASIKSWSKQKNKKSVPF